MGLTITFTCASEIPIFACTGWLLRTFGVDPVLHVVLGVFVLRFLLYTYLPAWNNPWLVLPIELLHGITFAGPGRAACPLFERSRVIRTA